MRMIPSISPDNAEASLAQICCFEVVVTNVHNLPHRAQILFAEGERLASECHGHGCGNLGTAIRSIPAEDYYAALVLPAEVKDLRDAIDEVLWFLGSILDQS